MRGLVEDFLLVGWCGSLFFCGGVCFNLVRDVGCKTQILDYFTNNNFNRIIKKSEILNIVATKIPKYGFLIQINSG